MTDSSHDPGPVEVRVAVRRARDAAFGAFKSEHDLVIDVRRSLGSAVSDAEIRAELRRRHPDGWTIRGRSAPGSQLP